MLSFGIQGGVIRYWAVIALQAVHRSQKNAKIRERETFELVVQVNGRVRDRVEVSSGSSEDELVEAAKSSERVQSFLDGKQIRQTVVVPGKLVNLVVG